MVAKIAGKGWMPIVGEVDVVTAQRLAVVNHPADGAPGTARLGDTVLVGKFGRVLGGTLPSVSFYISGTVTSTLLFLDDGWIFTVEPEVEEMALKRIVPLVNPRAEMF